MNRSDLVDTLSAHRQLPKKQAEQVVQVVLQAMTQALAAGRGIEIRGFGSFVCKTYGPRQGRNPRTGATVAVAAKRLPSFRPGKWLRQRVGHRLLPDERASGSEPSTDG